MAGSYHLAVLAVDSLGFRLAAGQGFGCLDPESPHTDGCYTTKVTEEKVLDCTTTEHVHTSDCYATSGKNEDGSDWNLAQELKDALANDKEENLPPFSTSTPPPLLSLMALLLEMEPLLMLNSLSAEKMRMVQTGIWPKS